MQLVSMTHVTLIEYRIVDMQNPLKGDNSCYLYLIPVINKQGVLEI